MSGRGYYGRASIGAPTLPQIDQAQIDQAKQDLADLKVEIRDFADKLMAQALALPPDKQGPTGLFGFVAHQWAVFQRAWLKFYTSADNESYYGWQFGGQTIQDTINHFRHQFSGLRYDASKLGFVDSSTAPYVPSTVPPPPPPPSGLPPSVLAPPSGPSSNAPPAPPALEATSSNTGLYVALGLGVLGVTAVVLTMR